MQRDQIIKFCDKYLDADKFRDFCINGLQIEGSPEVNSIITGVSLSKRLIEEAIKRKAQMMIVHHGLSGKDLGDPPGIFGFTRKRLTLMLEHNINLAGYHLPLDAHPVIGNNISIAKTLKLKKINTFNSPGFGPIGFVGSLAKSMPFNDFVRFVDKSLDTKSKAFHYGLKHISRIGIISGGAPNDFITAKLAGADTYLTGGIRESNVRAIEEEGMNFINAGHYNTEKMGIKNLGGLIAKKFKIKVEFVDIPCDI